MERGLAAPLLVCLSSKGVVSRLISRILLRRRIPKEAGKCDSELVGADDLEEVRGEIDRGANSPANQHHAQGMLSIHVRMNIQSS